MRHGARYKQGTVVRPRPAAGALSDLELDADTGRQLAWLHSTSRQDKRIGRSFVLGPTLPMREYAPVSKSCKTVRDASSSGFRGAPEKSDEATSVAPRHTRSS